MMIRLTNVSRNFGPVRAVRGVSFEVERGRIVGILGPNGAGKTTTIRIITGTLPPTAGRATVDGLDSVDDSRKVRSRLGYLPESAPLYTEMRVESYLRHRAGLYGMRGGARRTAIGSVLERCHLSDVRRRRIGQLSKGYRQRVGLASAMVHNPPVLILDEPTSGLDPSQIAETRSLIRDLAGDRTMLVVSHILPEVQRTCDRILVFARGRLRASGSPEELLRRDGGGSRHIVEARSASGESIVGAFKGRQGVSAATETALDDGWRRVRVEIGGKRVGDRDGGEIVGAACRDAGLLVRELRAETASLEEFYIRTVERADRDEAQASGGAAGGVK